MKYKMDNKMLIKNKKNKKANITVEKILGVILAVLCIFILIFLAAKLYNALVEGNTFEQAEATLSTITGIITGLKDTESRSYILTAPEGWYFVLYSLGDDERPERCAAAESCLCLCPRDNLLKNRELQGIDWGLMEDIHKRIEEIKNRFYKKEIIEKCSTAGLCQTLSKNIKMNSYFTQPSGSSSFKARQIVFTKNWVSMLWLKSIDIEQRDGQVTITEKGSPESNKFLNNLLNEKFKISGVIGEFTLGGWISDAFNQCSYNYYSEIKGKKDVQDGVKEYLKNKEIGGWIYVFAVDKYGIINTDGGKTTFDTSASNRLYDNSKKAIEKICDNQFKVYVVYIPEKQ